MGDSRDEVAADLFLPVQRASHLVEGGRQLAQLGREADQLGPSQRSPAVIARVTAISLATGRVIRRATPAATSASRAANPAAPAMASRSAACSLRSATLIPDPVNRATAARGRRSRRIARRIEVAGLAAVVLSLVQCVHVVRLAGSRPAVIAPGRPAFSSSSAASTG